MTDERFRELSDMALKLTSTLMDELELSERGLDDVPVFNAVMKGLVEIDGQSRTNTTEATGE